MGNSRRKRWAAAAAGADLWEMHIGLGGSTYGKFPWEAGARTAAVGLNCRKFP